MPFGAGVGPQTEGPSHQSAVLSSLPRVTTAPVVSGPALHRCSQAPGPSPSTRLLQRRPRWGLLASLILTMTAANQAVALDPNTKLSQYMVSFWQESAGLPQKFVNTIYQTRDGYLWVGTKGGVARFDGVRFEVYDDLHPDQLREGEVWAVAEAPDGSLWIGTYGGGLSRLVNGRFETLTTDEGLPSNQVVDLLQLPDGRLWIATLGGLVLRDADGTLTSFGVADGLPSKAILSLHLDARRNAVDRHRRRPGLVYATDSITNHAIVHPEVLGQAGERHRRQRAGWSLARSLHGWRSGLRPGPLPQRTGDTLHDT